MNTTLMKLLRDAWVATGINLTDQPRSEKKSIRTNIIESALRRNFALQKISPLHSPGIVRSRYMPKRLRVHTPSLEEHLNF